MEKHLQILLHLYDECQDPEEFAELLSDERLQAEYAQYAAVKNTLDRHSITERPDPVMLSRVQNFAASYRLRTRRRVRVYRLAGVSALAVAAGLAGIFIWPRQSAELPPWDSGQQLIDLSGQVDVLSDRSAVDRWDDPEVLRLDSLPPAGSMQDFRTVSD